MPPSRMSTTAVRRGTFRSSQAAARKASHAPMMSGSGRSARRVEAGAHDQQHQAGHDRKGQADAGHPEFSVHGAKSAIYPGGMIIRGPGCKHSVTA